MIQGQASAGHPVDIASGSVWQAYEDIAIPGLFPIVWGRRYSTDLLSLTPSAMGKGWTCSFFAALTRVEKDYHFRTPEGSILVFPDPDDQVEHGKVIRILGSYHEISKQGSFIKVSNWKVASGEVVRFVFFPGRNGQFWPLKAIEDLGGQGLDLAWDDKGLLKGVRQRLEKRTLVVSHTDKGLMSSVSFLYPDGRSAPLVRYEYDSQGMLCTAYDALNFSDRFEYDRDGRLLREIVKDGGVFSFKYDDAGKCIRTSGLDNYDLKALSYLPHIGWTNVTDSRGFITRYQWLPTGQVIQEINPLGGIATTEYDEHGRIVALTDEVGGRTEYGYSPSGDRNLIGLPGGAKTQIEFDANHQPIRMLDAMESEWLRTHDEAGRITETQDPMGHKWTFTYAPNGPLIEAIDPLGNRRRFPRAPNGELTAVEDWLGNATQLTWDAFGNIIQQVDPKGNITLYQYDLLGQVLSITHPNGAVIKCQYDAGGNVVSFTDGNKRTTRFTYGSCQRLLSVTNPAGETTTSVWGTEPEMLLKIINAKGEEHQVFYDEFGSIAMERTFDGRVLEYKYDAAARNVAIINSQGKRTSYVYDDSGRVTEKTLPDGSPRTYAFDKAGNVISVAGPDGKITFQRDPLGRILKEDQGGIVVETVYDAVGNPIRIATSLGHKTESLFDSNGNVISILADDSHRLEMKWDEVGSEIVRKLPGGFWLNQEFNFTGQLIRQSLIAQTGAKPTMERHFQYELGGNLVGIRDSQWGDTRYEYDGAERLLQAINPLVRETFSYDAAGNLVERRTDGLAGMSHSTLRLGPGGRTLFREGVEYAYDPNGRLIGKRVPNPGSPAAEWFFHWDDEDQLIRVDTPTGETWQYQYDPLGRRIGKQGPETDLRYIWHEGSILQIVSKGKVQETWIHSFQFFEPLAKIREGQIFSAITDHIGTPRELVDERGQVVWSAYYEAWGRILKLDQNKEDCLLRFPGQWFDSETGLHYSLYRYYDPDHGHFISPDPIGLNGGLNEYLYAQNPINWIDPHGLCKKTDKAKKKKEKPIIIIIDKKKYPKAAKHIKDNGPVRGRIDRPGAAGRRRASLKGKATKKGHDRDEVPPAILDTGGSGASVRLIPASDNRGAGSTMGHDMSDLPDGTLVELRSS